MMKKFLLLLGFFVSTFFSQAQNKDSLIILNTENPFLSIGKSVYFFEDKTALLSINDILKPENQKLFKKSENEILNFNTTFSRVWVKFTVQNQLDDKIYLEFSQALASYIDFYKPNEQQKPVLTTQTGIMRSFKNREIDYNFFLFELNRKKQAQTYYFSVRSDAPVIISLAVCNLKTLFENRYFHILFFGIFSGLIIIMFFYNLFLFFSFKDKSYLYYCLYLFVGIFFTNYLSGNYGYKYNLMTYFSNYLHFFVLLMSITISLFLVSLLQIRRKSVFFKVILSYLTFMGIAALVNLISGHYTYLNDAVQGITLIFYFYIFFKCLWLYYKSFSTAKFVVFGFSFYLFGVVLYLCQNLGFIPTNFVTNNAIVLGTAAEVLLFSLALGDRINIIRKEKEVSQAALLQQTQENEKIIKEQNALLEEKVNEKTLDLQTANEELQQTHEEILAQRDMVVQKNEELENYRHKISKSIESALLIQNAILPTKEKLSVLLKEFFIIYRPRDVVSGDFYWTNQIGEYKFAVVADCTGHGVSGAFMTMIGSGLLDRIIGVMKIHEPNLILETLHTQIQTLLQQEQTGNTDGMDILVTKWHEKNGEIHLEFSAAKRPLYFISSDDRSFHKIQGSRKMVGGMNKKEKYFEKNNIILKKNTLLYLTTDGYTHQNNAENKSISEKKLTEMLENLQDNTMSEQKIYLENFLNQHMKGCEQRDDILLVGIRL